MKKSQLSDKQLEELLGQMPKIKDHRDPRDIYQNIAHRVEKRKMPAWIIPSAALAAVLFLAFILSPGLMGVNHSADKMMDSKSATGDKSSMEMETAIRDDAAEESAGKQENTLMDAQDSQDQKAKDFRALDEKNTFDSLISLYEEEVDIATTEILTYAIPDIQAQSIVPVTVTVPKEDGENWVDSFTKTMPKLQEEEWGLSDYYPLDATWSYDEATETLTLDVKADHKFRYGSAAEVMFLNSMTQNFSGKGISKMLLTTEKKPGIELGNYGPMNEAPISSKSLQRRAYLFLTVDGVTTPYLVPTKEQHDTIGYAFAEMTKGNEELNLSASLPADFKLENTKLEKENNVLTISLTEETTIEESFLPSLEAILLTAKEFGYSGVKFENAKTDRLGPFNLNEVLPLPLAPNKKNIE